MKPGNFGYGAGGWPGQRPDAVEGLAPVDQLLLWCLRRLALLGAPGRARCHAAHIALQRSFGADGLGVEHLLRCWLVGLARSATRPLDLGTPGCPWLSGDEAVLLATLHAAGDARRARRLLAGIGPTAPALAPLFTAMAQLVANHR